MDRDWSSDVCSSDLWRNQWKSDWRVRTVAARMKRPETDNEFTSDPRFTAL